MRRRSLGAIRKDMHGGWCRAICTKPVKRDIWRWTPMALPTFGFPCGNKNKWMPRHLLLQKKYTFRWKACIYGSMLVMKLTRNSDENCAALEENSMINSYERRERGMNSYLLNSTRTGPNSYLLTCLSCVPLPPGRSWMAWLLWENLGVRVRLMLWGTSRSEKAYPCALFAFVSFPWRTFWFWNQHLTTKPNSCSLKALTISSWILRN